MSKQPIKTSKTISEFPKFQIGNISQAISSAFGKSSIPVPTHTADSSTASRRLGELKAKKPGSSLFLTEAEINEYEESKNTQSIRDALSYEEMIQEVDSMSNGLKGRHDDLAELRRKIARCQAGLEERELSYQGLHRSVNEIHNQNKSMMQKVKSMSTFKKY